MTARPGPALALVLLGALVTAPLLRFLLLPLVASFGPPFTPPPGDGPPLAAAFANSARLGLEAAACALAPALWLGALLERRPSSASRALAASLWLVVLLPGYLLAAGWQIATAVPFVRAHPALRAALLGWPGLVGLLALKGLPVATLAARAGWAAGDRRLSDAALIHVRSRRRRVSLAFRPVLPFAAAAFTLVFVEAAGDYGLAATTGSRLHAPFLVTEIYASLAQWPVSWPRAARAADLLVALSLLPLALRPLLDARTARPQAGSPAAASTPTGRFCCAAAAAILFAAGTLVPLLALGSDALADPGARLPAGTPRVLLVSGLYGFVGATASLLLAASLLSQQGLSARLAGFLCLANLAVPGVVLGAAFIIAFNGDPLPLIGTPLALLLAQTASHLPFMLLFLREPFHAVSGPAADAARVHGLARAVRIERVHLPPLARPLAQAFALVFSRIVFELPLSAMLAPAGKEPVGVVLVRLQQTLHLGAEARLATAALVACVIVTSAVVLIGGGGPGRPLPARGTR